MKQEKTKTKHTFLSHLGSYIAVAVGCLIMALAYNLFFIPNKIAPGGFSGLATLLFYFFSVPVGIATFVMCAPLFLYQLKRAGLRCTLTTIYGTFLFSAFVDLTSFVAPFTNDLLLASLFGGIVAGIGLGIILRFKGSTGGTDLLALLIHKKFPVITVGTWLLVIDFMVVALAGIAFHDIEVALYSVIAIYTSMKLIDLITEGLDYSKAFYILSKKQEEIKTAIYEQLDRGATLLLSKGGYTMQEQQLLFCVVSRTQVALLKEIIRQIDQNAFVIVTDAKEVLGEGFRSHDTP